MSDLVAENYSATIEAIHFPPLKMVVNFLKIWFVIFERIQVTILLESSLWIRSVAIVSNFEQDTD